MSIDLHITKHRGKMKGIDSLSTNSLNNEFCRKMSNTGKEHLVCSHCYSNKFINQYKGLNDILLKNDFYLSTSEIDFKELPIINSLWFRFNSFGALINKIHLENLIRICCKNPKCNFALWSKRVKLINDYFRDNRKPKNLILIFSNPIIDRVKLTPPKYFDKVFNVVTNKENTNCKKDCINCLMCYHKNSKTIIIEKLKNYGRIKT